MAMSRLDRGCCGFCRNISGSRRGRGGGERKGWNEGHHLAEGTFDEGLVADIGYKSFNALCRVN